MRSEEKNALLQAAQAPYLRQLRRLGATCVRSCRLVGALAATVPGSAVGQLLARRSSTPYWELRRYFERI